MYRRRRAQAEFGTVPGTGAGADTYKGGEEQKTSSPPFYATFVPFCAMTGYKSSSIIIVT